MKHIFAKVYQIVYSIFYSKRISTSISDNQAYPQICIRASNDYRYFNKFRRNAVYNQILEHVSKEQGAQILEKIINDPGILEKMDAFRLNDNYGDPRVYKYPGIGDISPTTLRYVKVLSDLKKHFNNLDDFSICEIGVGYGGQCRIINAHYKPSAYCLVDIQPALALAQRYLDNYILPSIVSYMTMNELIQREYDLVISNYAFSELSRVLQDVYLEKVIMNSKRGYITYNEITDSKFNSYNACELINMIPGSKILKEEPLTHQKNCIIVW